MHVWMSIETRVVTHIGWGISRHETNLRYSILESLMSKPEGTKRLPQQSEARVALR